MTDLIRIDVCDGKYTVVQHASGGTEILRYGEPWMGEGGAGFPGVNCVLAMAYELEELRAANLRSTTQAAAPAKPEEPKMVYCSDDNCYRTEDCGPFCRNRNER